MSHKISVVGEFVVDKEFSLVTDMRARKENGSFVPVPALGSVKSFDCLHYFVDFLLTRTNPVRANASPVDLVVEIVARKVVVKKHVTRDDIDH